MMFRQKFLHFVVTKVYSVLVDDVRQTFLQFNHKVPKIFPKHHRNKNTKNNSIVYLINKLLRNFLSELLAGQQR